jgi:DNA-binding transcriptional ArsR family regulator
LLVLGLVVLVSGERFPRGRRCDAPGRAEAGGAAATGRAVLLVCKNLRMDADNKVCGRDPDSQYVELAVEVFAMLADATRIRLILALRDGELSVNHLADIVDKSPAAVSQHLAKLRLARFVTTRQEGTRVFYRLENEHAGQLISDAIFQAEHSIGGTPRHHHPEAEAGA